MAAIEIAIPPRSVYVGVVRLTVTSLARSAGLDGDRVDDLRIAVTEACTSAVLAHEDAGTSEPVVVKWAEEADRFVIDVEGKVTPPEDAVEDSHGFSTRQVLSHALLESLVDQTELSSSGEGTRSRLILNKS
ncbi:MAG: ATP-binding protein [Actinobacteria bacterium]|nr:ATP-binding protein [Actinomycetota bacterium]